MRLSFFLLLVIPFLPARAQQKNSYYPSGFLHYSYQEKNGKLNGEFISYYENGLTKASGNFVEGEKQGSWKAWDTAGILRSKRLYRNNHDFDLLAEWNSEGASVAHAYLEKKKKDLVSSKGYHSQDADILYFQRYWEIILPGEVNKELFSDNFYQLLKNEITGGRVTVFRDNRFVNPIPVTEAVSFIDKIPGEYMIEANRVYYSSWQQMNDRVVGLGLMYKDNNGDKTFWLYVPDLAPVLEKLPGMGSLADKLMKNSFVSKPDMTTYGSKGSLPRKIEESERMALLLAEIDFETGAWVYLIDRDLNRERK